MPLICHVCPHSCSLETGQIGRCQVRHHNGLIIKPIHYGQCSILSLEPIEKRPFFHFDPGGKYLSVGFYGCSFFCKFCQNFSVSQQSEGPSKVILPHELIDLAKQKKANGIAFTFNEPTVYYEYLMDVGAIKSDLKMVVKTNGFVNLPILRDLCNVVDAFNVDIKGDDKEYQDVCGGTLQPVIDCVNELFSLGKHVEISYLATPRLLNDENFHLKMIDWLSSMPSVPVHLLFFYPFHKMSDVSYGVNDFVKLVDLFHQHIRYLYVPNLFHPDVIKYRNTHCPVCGDLMISRIKEIKVIKTECCNR